MKSNSKLVRLSALMVLGAAFLVSCNKTVTPRKIDGEWNVASYEESSSSSTSTGDTTYSSSSSSSFDGTTTTVSRTSGGVTISRKVTESMSVMFDRKAGTYEMNSSMTDPEYDTYSAMWLYAKDVNGNWVGDYYTRITSRTSTGMSAGNFTINGKSGDAVEANSQLTFQETSSSTDYDDTYTYQDYVTEAEVDASKLYTYEWASNSYESVETSESGSSTDESMSSYGEIWTIVELKGGEMKVEMTNDYDYSNSATDYTYSNSSSREMTLEAAE